MCRSVAEGGRRCTDKAHLRSLTTQDVAPKTREDVPKIAWAEDDLEQARARYVASVVDAAASRILADREAEPEITRVLMGVAEASGGYLGGLQYRMKSPLSLAHKIDSRIGKKLSDVPRAEQEERCQHIAGQLQDISRYTVVHRDQHQLGRVTYQTVAAMKRAGWSVDPVDVKYRQGAPYKGIHITGRTKEGVPVEVQIHSEPGLVIKEQSHKFYEIYRDPDRSRDDQRQAMQSCRRLYSQIETPRDLEQYQPKWEALT